jgi:hypothetical protein
MKAGLGRYGSVMCSAASEVGDTGDFDEAAVCCNRTESQANRQQARCRVKRMNFRR